MKKEILEWIKSILIAVIIALIITTFITPLEVYSISMNPTLVEHDFLLLRNTQTVARGDIVSFHTSLQLSEDEKKQLNLIQRLKDVETKSLIKRVIAIEGDELLIRDGKVYVNGGELEEDYINSDYTFGDIYIKEIPKSKIFVMGDNRDHSLDSRSIGLIDVEELQGKVLIRILPVNKFGIIG